ncbi:MAG: cobaltochelatase subunit CobN, partial [Myxococcota bacterium]
MTRRRTSAADHPALVVVLITMDRHIAGAVDRARAELREQLPNLELCLHAASDWADNPTALERCLNDIGRGHVVLANMLFMEDQVRAVLPALEARREDCDAMVGFIAAGEIIKLTRLGGFRMDGEAKGPLALLKRLRGSKKNSGGAQAGERQMAMLRRLPKILRFIPGTAQDVRAYFLTLQYWLAGSDDNIANMVRYLVGRYADGPRRIYRGKVDAKMPAHYPETGLYHPDLPRRVSEDPADLPKPNGASVGRVGVLVMRSYVLAGDARHYDGVIRSLEARGLEVVTAFAAGLDARSAIERYFRKDGKTTIDALVSLTGFSLVGGPAFNDADAARKTLAELDVPYLSAQAIEFQTVEQWKASARGLLPVESTIMVAIPEIDGATNPLVYGGRTEATTPEAPRAMLPIADRVERLTERVEALVRLRRARATERRIAIVLFNFPPNGGATGTAAFLSVFASLHATLRRLASEGYDVDVPDSVEELRERVLGGNSERYGTDANVLATVPVDDHVRREPHLAEIEAQWGPAPGRQQADGRSLFILGARFGSVLVGVQPTFGYEGDPMRLLFER